MVNKLVKPHIYLRVSNSKQQYGSGLDEQRDRIEQYIKSNHHLFTADYHEWVDIGFSAYKNKNIVDGKLGELVELVNVGKLGAGDHLIVYSIDRLSRRASWDEKTIQLIVSAGIRIHDITTPVVLDRDDPFSKIIFELILSRGHNESVVKSERSRSGWDAKHKHMVESGITMTKRLPRWLDWDATKGLVIKPREVSIIKRIFNSYVEGMSGPYLAKTLNAEKLLINDALWRPNAITKLIKDERLVGSFRGIKTQVVVPNIFPVIIEKDLFELANKRLSVNSAGIKGRVRVSKDDREVRNIITGICRCGLCGGPVSTSTNSIGVTYIRCRNRINFETCSNGGIRLDFTERALLGHIKQIDFQKLINNKHDDISELDLLNSEMELLLSDQAQCMTQIEERKKNKKSVSLPFAVALTDLNDRIGDVQGKINHISVSEPIERFEDYDIDMLCDVTNIPLRMNIRKMLTQVIETVSFVNTGGMGMIKINYVSSDLYAHLITFAKKTGEVLSVFAGNDKMIEFSDGADVVVYDKEKKTYTLNGDVV
ncbi:Resolvase%2C N terminal domain [Yersinia pekkanenii]|uniref:Resolvase, N terminal domain n=1 Tax=Yersinia pekkanenii TaxID=1288385 RepID=A0A0T9PTZ0_9GAMM|nr:recombinase family protein [Yersinia pekkanenii]CNH81450.1 Resolvase%2C N terminal domain [Yersinia pekkanenii]